MRLWLAPPCCNQAMTLQNRNRMPERGNDKENGAQYIFMRLSIGKKLKGAQLTGFTLFVILAIFSYISLDFYSSLQKRSAELVYKTEVVSDLQLLVDKILMPSNDYIITGNKAERKNFAALVTEVAKLFEKIRGDKRNAAEEAVISKDVENGIIDLEQSAMLILSIEKPVGNKEAARLMKEMDASGQRLEAKIEKLHDLIKAEMEAHTQKAASVSSWVLRIFVALALTTLSGLAYLFFRIKRDVEMPISALTEAVRIIGKGDLDYQIRIKTGDDIEVLGEEFNNMARALKEKDKEAKDYSEKLEKTNLKLDRNILQFYTLYNISKAISATFETEKLLNQIVKDVGQSLKIHRISTMLINSDRTEIYLAAALGVSEEAAKTRFSMTEGVYGWVAMTGHAEMINNPSGHPRFKPTAGFDDNVSSLIIAPFKGRGEVIGILTASKLGGEVFDEAGFELLTAAAAQIGMALDNARLFEETKALAIIDGMTSLYNYRYFTEHMREEFKRAQRHDRALSIIMIDVDHFKKYNDTNGHPQGDEALKSIAGIMKKAVRESDLVARYGGEEFIIILPETNANMALALAERLRKAVEAANFPGGEKQPLKRVTISQGVFSYVHGTTKNSDEMIKAADIALYHAKELGRNRVYPE